MYILFSFRLIKDIITKHIWLIRISFLTEWFKIMAILKSYIMLLNEYYWFFKSCCNLFVLATNLSLVILAITICVDHGIFSYSLRLMWFKTLYSFAHRLKILLCVLPVLVFGSFTLRYSCIFLICISFFPNFTFFNWF